MRQSLDLARSLVAQLNRSGDMHACGAVSTHSGGRPRMYRSISLSTIWFLHGSYLITQSAVNGQATRVMSSTGKFMAIDNLFETTKPYCHYGPPQEGFQAQTLSTSCVRYLRQTYAIIQTSSQLWRRMGSHSLSKSRRSFQM